MFLVITDTRVGEALHPNLGDLNFPGFIRLLASVDVDGLLHPNIMYFLLSRFSLIKLDLPGEVLLKRLLLPVESLWLGLLLREFKQSHLWCFD